MTDDTMTENTGALHPPTAAGSTAPAIPDVLREALARAAAAHGASGVSDYLSGGLGSEYILTDLAARLRSMGYALVREETPRAR